MYADLLRYLKAAFLLTLLVLAVLITLRLLDLPSGALVDWVVGVVSVWWLLLVTTVPWNVHFEATQALREAAASDERGIEVDPGQRERIRVLARRALLVALALHALTAAGLYVVAAMGWSPVGYVGALLALGLTFVRPAARAYAYLTAYLRAFRKEVHHPREDVVELRERLRMLEAMLDPKADASWATRVRTRLKDVTTAHERLASAFERLAEANASEHTRLEHEYRSALATVTEDRRFVEHLREIVRFVRRA